jgi:mRNA interferase MazF
MSTQIRGRVIWFELAEVGQRPAVVVSNDARNRALGSALVARITNSPKPRLSSIVELTEADPMAGRVLCDELIEVNDKEVVTNSGPLSPTTLRSVEAGLMNALGITPR